MELTKRLPNKSVSSQDLDDLIEVIPINNNLNEK